MILNQKPLNGNNFEDWKTNLYIVLDYEKIKFVPDTPKSAIPEAGVNDITKTNVLKPGSSTERFSGLVHPLARSAI